MAVQRQRTAYIVQDLRAAVLTERDIAEHHGAVQPDTRIGIGGDQGRRHQFGQVELLDHLLILDPDILLHLIIVEQLLPGAGQILVGRQHRHQRAEADAALDHQITADQIKEERRELIDEVVQKLDEELALEDLEPDIVDVAVAVRDIGQMPGGSIVGVDLGHAGNRFADPVRDLAHRPDALLAKLVDLALKARDQPSLEGIERDRRGPQNRVLHEDEGQIDQQRAALENRQRYRVADKSAQRLHFRRDHGDDLALADLAEAGQREAYHPCIKLIAQPAQHALAQPPFEGVYAELEDPVDHHQRQEKPRQQNEIRHLIELESQRIP